MERARVSQTEQSTTAKTAPITGWRAVLRDLAQMVRFYSRLPVPKLPFEHDAHAAPEFATAPRMLPLAGLIIGIPAALALLATAGVGLPAFVVAAITIALAMLSTGAFHEDGLADTFDGLGGGWTPERRLEIMKDSRIGSYGGAALMLSLILRISLLAALIDEAGIGPAVMIYLATASLSRFIALMPIVALPPARASGFSSTVGRPSNRALLTGAGIAIVIALPLAIFAGWQVLGLLVGVGIGVAIASVLTFWAKRAIGGQTGDIAGACQQVAESALYVGFLMMIY